MESDEQATARLNAFLYGSDHWRKRGEQMQVFAKEMKDPVARSTMLRIAADYERLAKRAEERASGKARATGDAPPAVSPPAKLNAGKDE
jgi:hypothetical protein